MEPLPSGASQGNVVPLDGMLDEYYSLMAWESYGVPTADCALRLGLATELAAATAR